jgi:hypothetical protein
MPREAQVHSGGDAAHLWGAYYGAVLAACHRRGVRYLGVRPAQWKKTAGLLSRTGEAEALEAARRQWPRVEFASADEAVACYVLLAAREIAASRLG